MVLTNANILTVKKYQTTVPARHCMYVWHPEHSQKPPINLYVLQECEECRIYTPTLADDDVSGNCSVRCPQDSNATTFCPEGHSERESKSDVYAEGNLHYGEVMFTQFISTYRNIAQ